MSMLVNETLLVQQVIADRRARGIDQYDEVWEGVYVVPPLANIEHQGVATGLAAVFYVSVQMPVLGEVFGGINVSDRDEDWKSNYRIPDVAVVLRGCRAVHRITHWVGGPNFLVEVGSEGDQRHDKLPFYETIGVEEVLIVNRDPWSLELYRLTNGKFALIGTSDLTKQAVLESSCLPLSFQLQPGSTRPLIRVRSKDGKLCWDV